MINNWILCESVNLFPYIPEVTEPGEIAYLLLYLYIVFIQIPFLCLLFISLFLVVLGI